MLQPKILDQFRDWLPKQLLMPEYYWPGSPYKPELRKPLLWLDRMDNEVYLINSYGETLELVTAGCGGFQTADDQVITVSSENGYSYENILPGQAVKVEQYDDYYDCDYVLQIHLLVKSANLGTLKITSPAEKGGLIKQTVLLWDTGETGKYVNLKKI